MNIDMKQPVNFLVYCLAVGVFGALARIGWEVGGKIWQLF